MSARNAHQYIDNIGGLGAHPNSNMGMFETTDEFPLLSLVSMIAPTPDWLVGVSSLKLKEDNGCWKSMVREQLMGYDAGTEQDTGYTLANPPESQHKPIGPITTLPVAARNVPFAALTLELL